MQLGRAPLNACRPLARLGSTSRRICVVRATGTKQGSNNPVTQSLLDFFEDITEGARDGPRRRAAQEHEVPDVTDIASKVHEAADAVEAAAASLQGMLGDASSAMAEAFGGLDGRVAGLKQQLLKGEKDVEAVVDEVVHVISNDARKIASTLAGGDKQAADAAHAALDAAVAKAQKLRIDAKQGLVTAEHAAEEVVGIARSMLQEVQHLLTPKAARTAVQTAGQTSGQTASQSAMAAMRATAEFAAKAAKADTAKPAAATSAAAAAAATPAPAAPVKARSGGSAAADASDAAAAALEATAAAAAVIAEKGLAMAEKAAAPNVEALAVALDAQVTSLRAKAGQLQLQAASGSTTTSEAVKALLGQFSDAIGAIEQNVTAGTVSGGASAAANASLQTALQRCRKDAVTGARMVAEAAARQDISSERAVQYLSSLLRQLAADVSSELTQQGKQQQKPAAAAGYAAAPRAVSGRAPGAAADSVAVGASGGSAASGLQDSEIVVASVDELELVLQDASSQSQVVRAAAKGFAAAEAAAASLQQRLPEFKQALAATAAVDSNETARQAAARILTGAAGEVEGQLAELQAEMLARSGGGEAGAAAAASLQLLRDNVEARVRELAGKVEAGQVKPTAALDELLLGLQTSISGELRSCLLDSLSQSSTPSSASISSMSDEEIAAQLATAIADARKERAAAANEGLEEAIAAGKLAAWVFKAALGVGALQLVKVGSGLAMERAGVALPGALAGMLCVATLLTMIGEAGAQPLVNFYDAYLSWTTGMLPLFYVPTLAVVPSLLQGTDVSGLLGASVAGTAASLLFAAAVASLLTPKPEPSDDLLATSTPAAKSSSQQNALLAVAAFAAVAPLVLTKFDPTAFGQLMTVPVGLAWSVFGFLAGRAVGMNPMLIGAAAANAGVFWHGKLMGWGYAAAIDAFFGQGAGAGELLTAVLGMALTGLGFVIYKQRRSISIPAVAVTAVAAAAFNVMSTVAMTHLVPLTDVWSKALLARGISSTLAPAVASGIGASAELAAIAVLLQAAVTVVLGSTLLKLFAGDREAAAGIAAGCTAGGIGAAAVGSGKPAALANGVLAYVAVHALSAAMLGVPAVGEALQAAVAMAAA